MKTKIAMLCCVVLLVGCAELGEPVRQFGIDFAGEDVKNSAAIREMAVLFKEAWPEASGFWRRIFGDDITLEMAGIMDRLDELSDKPELTGKEAGDFVALRLKFCIYLKEFLADKIVPYVGLLI